MDARASGCTNSRRPARWTTSLAAASTSSTAASLRPMLAAARRTTPRSEDADAASTRSTLRAPSDRPAARRSYAQTVDHQLGPAARNQCRLLPLAYCDQDEHWVGDQAASRATDRFVLG